MMYEGSAVTQQAWDHNHRIDWMSVCVLGSESLKATQGSYPYPEAAHSSEGQRFVS